MNMSCKINMIVRITHFRAFKYTCTASFCDVFKSFYTYKGKHTVFDLRKCDLRIFYKMETSRYKK